MRYRNLVLLALLCLFLSGCAAHPGDPTETADFTVWLNMNTEFPATNSLPEGDGKPAKVIVLLGQSNATGCSLISYLEQGISKAEFEQLRRGFDSVRINFCVDDHTNSSQGEFRPVDLTCGSSEGRFGPEVGMAQVLAQAYPAETVFILKYTMSGYSLHHHWLCDGQRGSIYEACLQFVRTYMDQLHAANYDARIGAVCWMQGESDTTHFKASRYLDNQTTFVSYLREDLQQYAEDGGICFIDAGISNSPYCEPAYPQINEAKVEFAKLSPLNYYFSTIDAGFTIHKEPEGDPDWGHYDALSELELGRLFGKNVIQSYLDRKKG